MSADGLLGQLRSQQRVIRVAVAQSEQDAFLAAARSRRLIVREQELADPLECIVAAPAVPSCSAADVLGAPCLYSGRRCRRERVRRRGWAWSKCGGVLSVIPARSVATTRMILIQACSAHYRHRSGAALPSTRSVILPAIQIDEAGHVDGVVLPLRREERGLVGSEAQAPLDVPRVLDQLVPRSTTTSITVHRHMPSSGG